MDPDSGGPETCGSGSRCGSGTLINSKERGRLNIEERHAFFLPLSKFFQHRTLSPCLSSLCLAGTGLLLAKMLADRKGVDTITTKGPQAGLSFFFYSFHACSTPYLLVGLDYVKDRWAFQKEDGSEHKEHLAWALPRDIVTRCSSSFFSFMDELNSALKLFLLICWTPEEEKQLQFIPPLPNFQKHLINVVLFASKRSR